MQSGDDLRRFMQRAKKLGRRSLRLWPLQVVALLAALGAAIVAPLVLEPVYVSSAVLVYREMIPPATLSGHDAPVETPRQRGARLRELVMARANLEAIIDEFGLYPRVIAARGKVDAVEEFLTHADCKVGEDTFAIKFEYGDPELTQKVTARLAQSMIDQSARFRLEQAKSTTKFLEAQRVKTKRDLADKEEALARFLAGHPEFAQDVMASAGGMSQAGASIRAQERKAAVINPTVAALERQRSRLYTRMESIDDPTQMPVVPPTATVDPQIAATLEHAGRDYQRAQEEVSQARARYTDAHPDLRYAEGRMARAKAALQIAQQGAFDSTPPPPAAAPPATEKDRSSLTKQLTNVQQNLSAAAQRKANDKHDASNWIVELETEWAGLNREVYDVRERYQHIERRYFQASIIDHVEASGGAAQMTVADPAYLPERPTRLGARRVAAAAAGAVLLLFGIMLAFLAYLDDRLYDVEDVRGMSFIGLAHAVPAAPKGKPRG